MERPSKIICIGRNYADHAKELGNEVPKAPLLFLKAPSALIGNDETIVLPPESAQVEYEAEIGVVVGRKIHHAGLAEAEAAIRGFVCVNDVTARDLQRADGQWTRAKGF
ncbi:MAG TPA: fumarylacetoacetate hydrolase family protein, partial [Gemmatimonadales bacterium]|nr:fumarylacetoacetate hydrolase family protein [Gemmatimonadales bacterium]